MPTNKANILGKFLLQRKCYFYLQQKREDVQNMGAQIELELKQTILFCSSRRK